VAYLKRFQIFSLMVFGSLLLASSALASKPPAYQGNAGAVQQQVSGAHASNTLGQLPFTGLDLALIVGGGLLLVIAGVSLRRVSNRRA